MRPRGWPKPAARPTSPCWRARIAQAEHEHGADRSVRHAYIDFHRQIIRLAHNPLLAIVGETVLLVLYDRVKAVLSAETTEVGLIMHRQLVNACRNRQPAEARAHHGAGH